MSLMNCVDTILVEIHAESIIHLQGRILHSPHVTGKTYVYALKADLQTHLKFHFVPQI